MDNENWVHENEKFMCINGHNQQNEKAAYRIWENICISSDKRLLFLNCI